MERQRQRRGGRVESGRAPMMHEYKRYASQIEVVQPDRFDVRLLEKIGQNFQEERCYTMYATPVTAVAMVAELRALAARYTHLTADEMRAAKRNATDMKEFRLWTFFETDDDGQSTDDIPAFLTDTTFAALCDDLERMQTRRLDALAQELLSLPTPHFGPTAQAAVARPIVAMRDEAGGTPTAPGRDSAVNDASAAVIEGIVEVLRSGRFDTDSLYSLRDQLAALTRGASHAAPGSKSARAPRLAKVGPRKRRSA